MRERMILMTPLEVAEIAFGGPDAFSGKEVNEAAILVAQQKHVRPVLNGLYGKFQEGKYTDLLNDYVKPALALYVKWLVLGHSPVSTGVMGTVQYHGENFGPAGHDQLRAVRNQTLSDAAALMRRAVSWIESRPGEYPEYDPEKNVLRKTKILGKVVL